MDVLADISSLRTHLRSKRLSHRIALVATMGALHEGHRACIDVARRVEDGYVVVSIFVNPTQFAPGDDYARYPHDLERDLELCRTWGCDAVFTPSAEEMYPRAQQCWVDVEGLTDSLCGRSRPGHFRGVATVVIKLFNAVAPDVAVFGQKDAQQALVIREMIRQLNIPVELRIARIAREDDGLARSSRNAFLDPASRRQAVQLCRALQFARERVAGGERDPRALEAAVKGFLSDSAALRLEYAEVRAAGDLSALERIEGRVILALAASVGGTRLIDNIVFDVADGDAAVDVELF